MPLNHTQSLFYVFLFVLFQNSVVWTCLLLERFL